MNSAGIERFRQKLRDDTPAYGLWVSLDAPAITEMAVALGLDWVVIDTEHGHLDWQEVVSHIRCTARSGTLALVRLVELNGGLIKRALDIGADGVVIPYIETATQLKQAITYARYPLEGVRGIGADRATVWGQCLKEHTSEANEHVLVIPIIETVRAVAEVPAMCRLAGTEVFFFGPADFSASAGFRGEWEGPGVAQQLIQLKDTIRSAGKHCGILGANNDDLLRRKEQGFRMIGLGLDVGLFLRSLRGALAAVGRDQPMRLY
jgi:2-keto-3-deoxy-L-rhamnonate aldolase RhmA